MGNHRRERLIYKSTTMSLHKVKENVKPLKTVSGWKIGPKIFQRTVDVLAIVCFAVI